MINNGGAMFAGRTWVLILFLELKSSPSWGLSYLIADKSSPLL